MPIETTLLALPVTDLVILGALLLFGCVVGWKSRSITSRGREAALKRSLFEAKGAVPQLESAVRNREQRAETLSLTVQGLKERVSELETSIRQKELEIDKRDREIRSLSSELTILKQGPTNGQVVLLDGMDAAAEPETADPEMAKRYAALEARYEALTRGLFQRDDRIAELEEQLKNPGGEVPVRTLETELAELEQTASELRASLEEREQQLTALQTRLEEEVVQREALEDLAKRRSDSNREHKAAAAKFEQQIPELKDAIRARDAQIIERDDKLVALTRSLKVERQQREGREAEVNDLSDQLTSLQTRQRDLQKRLNEQEEAHRALQTELETTRETLRATESAVREREAALAEAAERSAAGERTVATLQSTIKDRDFRIAVLTKQSDEQRESLEQAMADQRLALAERARERNELEAASAELSSARERADSLTRHIACLTESLDRSDLALRQSRCAILLLVARANATPLLLPAPIGTQAAG